MGSNEENVHHCTLLSSQAMIAIICLSFEHCISGFFDARCVESSQVSPPSYDPENGRLTSPLVSRTCSDSIAQVNVG